MKYTYFKNVIGEYIIVFAVNEPNEILIASTYSEEMANTICSQLNQSIEVGPKEIKCQCSNEIKTGTTTVACCNVCGLPDEDFWTNDAIPRKKECKHLRYYVMNMERYCDDCNKYLRSDIAVKKFKIEEQNIIEDNSKTTY